MLNKLIIIRVLLLCNCDICDIFMIFVTHYYYTLHSTHITHLSINFNFHLFLVSICNMPHSDGFECIDDIGHYHPFSNRFISCSLACLYSIHFGLFFCCLRSLFHRVYEELIIITMHYH